MSNRLPALEVREDDPRRIAIMEAWVRKIVREVADEVADGICEKVGRIFLDAKTGNYESADRLHKRMEAIEAALKQAKGKAKP